MQKKGVEKWNGKRIKPIISTKSNSSKPANPNIVCKEVENGERTSLV